MSINIALIADDEKKNELVNFVQQYQNLFSGFKIIATAKTGEKIEEKTGLTIEKMASASLGGYVQIGSKIVNHEISAVFCLIDSAYPQEYEPDAKALFRLCQVYNLPLATNLATAKAIIDFLGKTRIAHLIFNPVAGQGNAQQELDLIQQYLRSSLNLNTVFTSADVNVTEQVKDIVNNIMASEQKQDSFIIAAGGDGTVSEVASALISTGIPLGVIPRGTANAFAVALGIPTQIQSACETICRGITKVVDTAMCNETSMLLLTGIGFEAETIAKADRDLKNRLGIMAYIFAGIQQVKEQVLFETDIDIDGKVITMSANAITIANAAPSTSVFAQGAGEVPFNDGLLDITITSSETTFQKLQVVTSLFASALVKNPSDNENVLHFRGKNIKVNTNPPQKVVVDGEIIGTTPVEIKCIPNSLNLFVPLLED